MFLMTCRIQGETKADSYTGRTINPCRIQGEMFLTPTRREGEVSSKSGRIQGGTKADTYTEKQPLCPSKKNCLQDKAFHIEHK